LIGTALLNGSPRLHTPPIDRLSACNLTSLTL